MSRTAYRYVHVDVFTRQPFGGNQLAVFIDARGLADEQMQAIAREMSFSETTFVLPAENPTAEARVRIFSVAREMPFAGHPVVGTGFVLGAERGRSALSLQLQIGTLAVDVDRGDGLVGSARMEQPLPRFRPATADRATLAALVGLEASDLSDAPPEFGSAGVEFLYLPLRSLETVRRARGDERALRRFYGDDPHPSVYVFSTETHSPEAVSHGRMFFMTQGLQEDPATGGASGPLGAYLVRHRLAQPGLLLLEQGYEMLRPSQVEVEIEVEPRDGTVRSVRVGGGVVRIAEGQLLA